MRPNINTYFMSMAILASTRATCPRRKVGAILVDSRNHVLATGYNGVPSGIAHCIDVPCPGASSKSGEGLDKCQALHAEQNALLQCKDVYAIKTLYVTTAPCMSCVKLLFNTTCIEIVYLNDYPHLEAKEMWESCGRSWIKFTNIDELLVKI